MSKRYGRNQKRKAQAIIKAQMYKMSELERTDLPLKQYHSDLEYQQELMLYIFEVVNEN